MPRFSRSPSPRDRDDGHVKRRRDDRYDGRAARRSRSRSRDRRDDRYYRRRERSPADRRRDGYYDSWDRDRERDRDGRPSERPRSRPDRDRGLDRDRRNRSKDRSKDRDGRKDREKERDGGRDKDRGSRKPEDKGRRGSKQETPPPPAPISEEEKIKQRKERLEAWKRKRAEEEEAKKKASTPAAILSALDRPTVAEVAPKVTVASTQPKSPLDAPPKSATSAPISSAARSKADNVVPVAISPVIGKFLPLLFLAVFLANRTIAAPTGSALPSARPVSTFGFGAKKSAPEKGKRTLNFDDEQATRKKLERLPSPAPEDTVMLPVDVEQDEDDDTIMQEGTEEESAAAARAAAAQRAERQQISETLADQTEESKAVSAAEVAPEAEDEEPDPLDAFMMGIGDAMEIETAGDKKDQDVSREEALYGDDEVELVSTEADPDDILAMAAKLKKKKELPTVNHAKVNYDPFRKNFYVEPAELAEMTEEEVDDLRLELDGIKIRGQDCPKPVQKWSQCGIPAQTLEVIQSLGYEKPTSIQAQAIPAIMSGRNVIGVAKTGSGKTIAFLLPMFRHIKDQRALDPLEGPISLIMTPTRELAVQIHKECKPFLKALNLRAVCAYGGSPIKDQIADLKRGAEIIVCTPGRMIDLLAANSGRVTNLKRVTYIVLDEADRMFDMGFEPQVMKIIQNVRPDRQTVLFSATFPRQMEALARKILQRPVEIVVGARSVVAPEVTQVVEVRNDDLKFHRLLELLGDLYDKDEDARTLIFVDRQESADTLLRDLMRRGYPCMSIHGGKDQIDRDSTISDFKAGVVPVLVATSVAARGLDVKQLKLVVNYDCPNHMEDYVHRVGRTGRAGNVGTAVTFITEEQGRYAVDISKALKLSGQKIPEDVQKLVDGFNEKVKAGKEKSHASGFGGKGLEKLDQERDLARRRERKQYGEEGGEAEPEEETTVTEQAASEVLPAGLPPKPPVKIPTGPSADAPIIVYKGAAASVNQDALDRVRKATMTINNRLNKSGELRSGVPIDNKGPDAGAFHATLEINDFPQKARWAVTNRTNIAKVLEATGTSITTKGTFYPPGKAPQAGQDPKLYILVEGDTELVVTNAMRELKRLLAEGTAAAVDSENRAPASSRYSVL
ncbi:P-loop containing nucleoside triphosphate hydrolase protein [Peziza echinospora]|nr:P-loop containing nucleoside triphosphate hydrolase protein [Peziza echinospora]